HIFRRTTATIIDAAAGITLASRLLGHANAQVTRSNYVVTAEMVDPVTAHSMDDAVTAMLGTWAAASRAICCEDWECARMCWLIACRTCQSELRYLHRGHVRADW